jgi:hypothetical protein
MVIVAPSNVTHLRWGWRVWILCHAGSLRGCLLKDTHNLRLKFLEIHGQHGSARMENEVAARGQQVQMPAQGLFHASLDAIAFMGFAHHLAGGEADARASWGDRG